jgi:glycosyltransferase involved in cell wall biosynthesis
MSVSNLPAYELEAPARAGGRVAVLIPCYNEELTVGEVIRKFRAELPEADIYVCDNNSTDRTAEVARAAGAVVSFEPRKGKGYAIQTMFREIDADYYVMIDGDETYPADAVRRLLRPVLEGRADVAVGSRLLPESRSEFGGLSLFGNRLMALVFNALFGTRLTDILTGYRVYSREYAKGVPLFCGGFEIEMEIMSQAHARGFRIVEVPVALRPRPPGSYSKANLFVHGPYNLFKTVLFFRDHRPLAFYGWAALLLAAAGSAVWLAAGAALAGAGLVWAATLALAVGLVLQDSARRARESEHHARAVADELGRRLGAAPPRHSAKGTHDAEQR